MTVFAGFLLLNLIVLLAMVSGRLAWFTAAGQPSFYFAFLAVNLFIAWTYWRRRRASEPDSGYAERGDWFADGMDGVGGD